MRIPIQATLLTAAWLAPLAAAAQSDAAALPRFAGPKVPVGQEPRRLLVADLDGDGLDDVLATGEAGAGVLSVRRSLGDGLLDDGDDLVLGGAPWGVDAGDLDGDGDLDAVVTLGDDDGFAVLFGDGAGGFAPPLFVPSLDAPREIVLADVDLDGALDAVLTGAVDDLLAVHPGSGAAPILSVAPAAEPLAVVDLDGDGDLDAVVGELSADALTVLHGDGTGLFTPVQALPIVGKPERIVPIDVDGDGDPDLAASGSATQVFQAGEPATVFDNAGAGLFGGSTGWSFVGDPCGIGLAAADLDGDGVPDLAYAGFGECGPALFVNGPIQVLVGLGGGAFAQGERWSTGVRPRDLATGDVDGDGTLDLVSLSRYGPFGVVGPFGGSGPGDVSVYRGLGGAAFHHARSQPPTTPGKSFQIAVVTDVDGDGRLDLIATEDDELVFALGRGDASFSEPVDLPSPWGLEDLQLADLDADGDVDVLAVDDGFGLSTWLDVGAVLAAGPRTPLGVATTAAAPVDLDGDDLPDVVAGGTQQLHVLPGTGGGTFGASTSVPLPGSHVAVRAGDLDGDGLPDVASLSQAPNQLHGVLGDGALGLAPTSAVHAFAEPTFLELGDLDLDGDLDAVTLDVLVAESWLGDGAGGFVRADIEGGLSIARALDISDVDVDGLPDVLIGLDDSGDVAVYRGDGSGMLVDPVYLPVAGVVSVVRGAQLDADRPLEIVASALIRTYVLEESLTPWRDLGSPLAGALGPPRLEGEGLPAAGETVTLHLSAARASTAAVLVVGFTTLGAPFKGGTLWPSPDLLAGGLVTDPAGAASLRSPWPAGIPAGVSILLQAWIPDGAAPVGLAASNGVEIVVP